MPIELPRALPETPDVMSTLLLLLLGLLILAALVLLKLARRMDATPYRLTDKFLSKAERSFFGVLSHAIGEHALVFAKVRVADVLAVKPGLSASKRQSAFNRIQAKHFDFLICSLADARPLLAIELDDRSHRLAARVKRDAFLNRAAEAAGLPLLRVSAAQTYSIAELRREIAPHLGLRVEPTIQAPSEPRERSEPALDPPSFLEPLPDSSQPPTCPKCGGAMVERRGETGELAGKAFWSCAAYPECRGVRPIATGSDGH